MSKRTRLFLLTAAGVLVTVLTTGLIAWAMGMPVLAALGSSGPDELAFVPADARMVAYADVRQLMGSPFHDRIKAFEGTPSTAPNGLQARTGIDPERDIDHVLVASVPGQPPRMPGGASLLVARGRFDVTRIEGVMREQGGEVEQYRGIRVVSLKDGQMAASLAFVEPGLIVFGTRDFVRSGIDAKAGTAGSIRTNDEFMKLAGTVDDGTAWSVAKMDSLTGVGGLPPAIAAQLPPINWLAASGHVDAGLRAFVRAQARDAESAKNLREVVQGFVALMRMQGTRQPEYKGVFDSLALTADGDSVSLSFEMSPAALDAIASGTPFRRPGAQRPPADPNAPQRF